MLWGRMQGPHVGVAGSPLFSKDLLVQVALWEAALLPWAL